jgi:hypothetical protein
VVNEKNVLKIGLSDRDSYIDRLNQNVTALEQVPANTGTKITEPAKAPELPPTTAQLTVSLEPRTNSRSNANYETQVTVSATVVFSSSVKLTLTCDHRLIDVQGSPWAPRAMTLVMRTESGKTIGMFMLLAIKAPPQILALRVRSYSLSGRKTNWCALRKRTRYFSIFLKVYSNDKAAENQSDLGSFWKRGTNDAGRFQK